MKKILILLSFICLVYSQPSGGGNGTAGNPYILKNKADLIWMGQQAGLNHYSLGNDITGASKTTDTLNVYASNVVSFNGNGYKISNFNMPRPLTDSPNNIRNLKIENIIGINTILTRLINLATIRNVHAKNIELYPQRTTESGTSVSAGVLGTISGTYTGAIRSCTFDNIKIIIDVGTSYQNMYAGIIGGNVGNIDTVSVTNSLVDVKMVNMTSVGSYGILAGNLTRSNNRIVVKNNEIIIRDNVNTSRKYIGIFGSRSSTSSTTNLSNSYAYNNTVRTLLDNGYFYISTYNDILAYEDNLTFDKVYTYNNFILATGTLSKTAYMLVKAWGYARDLTGYYGADDSSIPAVAMFNSNWGNITGHSVVSPASNLKLKSTYSNFDWDNIWDVKENVNNGFPYLRWEPVTAPVVWQKVYIRKPK
jgi:hypothetical protein